MDSGWREGRKEGGGGRRTEPRQLEFLRRKDRARRESAFSRAFRDGRRRARSLASSSARSPRRRRGIAPLPLFLSSPLLREEGDRGSPALGCLRLNSGSEKWEEEEEEEEDGEEKVEESETSEGGRRGRNKRTSAVSLGLVGGRRRIN